MRVRIASADFSPCQILRGRRPLNEVWSGAPSPMRSRTTKFPVGVRKDPSSNPAPLAEVEAKASKIFFSSLNRVTCCRSRETSIRQRWSGQFIWDNGDQRSCGSAGRDSSESGASSFRFGSWGFMPRRSMSARSFSIAGFLAVRSLSP